MTLDILLGWLLTVAFAGALTVAYLRERRIRAERLRRIERRFKAWVARDVPPMRQGGRDRPFDWERDLPPWAP